MKVKKGSFIEERDLGQRDHSAAETDHMSECVTTGKDVLTPGHEGLRDLKIMIAIYKAARMGKTIKL
jgi:predicted dehydrogenase